MLGSFYLFGCGVGALIFSYLSMRLGRKKLFETTLIIYIISTILFSLSFNYEMMVIMRFMTGIGVGGEYTAIFAAVDELIPA